MTEPRLFNVYCDESCHLEHDGVPVMAWGAVYCPADASRAISEAVRTLKAEHGLARHFEAKWTKVSPAKADFYLALIDLFLNDERLRFRGLEADQLRREVAGMGRLKGIATVRRCVEHSAPVVDSGSESLARGLLVAEGIGPLTPQYSIGNYRVDLLVDGWLIIEIDGAFKYRGPDAEAVRQREFNRQKKITNQGYMFLRYSPEFVRRNPHRFIAEVRETLASRGRLRG